MTTLLTERPRPGMKGLFAGLKGRGADPTLDVPRAVMIPIAAAMLADGRVEDEEIVQIEAICATSPLFDRNSPLENERMVLEATRRVEDRGMEAACKEAASLLTPALRETAFAYAVKVIFADGYVGELEQEAVQQLVDWLEIDAARARMFVEVVSVLQHPASA